MRAAESAAVNDTGPGCALADGLPCPWAWASWAEPGTCNQLHRQALTQAGVEPGPGSGCGLQVGAKAGRGKGRAGDKATLRSEGSVQKTGPRQTYGIEQGRVPQPEPTVVPGPRGREGVGVARETVQGHQSLLVPSGP